METYSLSALVHKEGCWYVASSPSTDIASQGKTIEEALKNLKEAVELYIEEIGPLPNDDTALLTKIEVKVKNGKTPRAVSA